MAGGAGSDRTRKTQERHDEPEWVAMHKALAPSATPQRRCSTRSGTTAQTDSTAGGAGSDRTRNPQERHDEPAEVREAEGWDTCGDSPSRTNLHNRCPRRDREHSRKSRRIAMVRDYNGLEVVDGPNVCVQLRPATARLSEFTTTARLPAVSCDALLEPSVASIPQGERVHHLAPELLWRGQLD